VRRESLLALALLASPPASAGPRKETHARLIWTVDGAPWRVRLHEREEPPNDDRSVAYQITLSVEDRQGSPGRIVTIRDSYDPNRIPLLQHPVVGVVKVGGRELLRLTRLGREGTRPIMTDLYALEPDPDPAPSFAPVRLRSVLHVAVDSYFVPETNTACNSPVRVELLPRPDDGSRLTYRQEWPDPEWIRKSRACRKARRDVKQLVYEWKSGRFASSPSQTGQGAMP
jgi:hypothetical protein